MDKILETWRRRISPAAMSAFLGCFAAGYIAHLFAFTNIIPNADGLSRVADPQQMTISGRWFLHYATAFNGFVQAPAVIGFFSVLFLACSAALTVSLFQMKSRTLSGLSGVLMAVFPAVAFTFLYMFTASAYCFGILLAVSAVWLTARGWRYLLPAAVLLACSVGTYQAYFAVAVSLSVISILLFALEKNRQGKEILFSALRFLALLLAGLLLYFGILRFFLRIKDLTLIAYKGIDAMGQGSMLARMLSRIGYAYRSFASFFFHVGGFSSYLTPGAAAVHFGFTGLGLWAFLKNAADGGLFRRKAALILALAMCILLPLALNLTVLMGDATEVMRYALVFTYVLALALLDRSVPAETDVPVSKGRQGFRKLALIAAVLLSLWMGIFCCNVDNLAYTASATAHRATESFATRLVERVESAPGYRRGMEVIIIGSFPTEAYRSGVDAFRRVDAPADSVMTLNKHVYYYMNDWLNVPWPEPDEETLQAVSDSEAFQAMPLYPDDGSVAVINDRVVVRLAERYQRKQDYEIQYENRR